MAGPRLRATEDPGPPLPGFLGDSLGERHQTLVGDRGPRSTYHSGAHDAPIGQVVCVRRRRADIIRPSDDALGKTIVGHSERPLVGRRGGSTEVAMGGPRVAKAAREPLRRLAVMLTWRKAWLLKTARGLNYSAKDPGRLRLQRGHRRLGKPRWDEVLQAHVEQAIGEDTQWEEAA